MTRGANDFSSPRNKKMPANASDLSIGLPGRQIESGDALPPPILPPQFSGPHRGARRTGSVDSPVKGPRQLANRYSAQKRNTRRRPAETPKSPITDPTPQQIEMMMNGLKSAREGRKRLE
jgi:hypothetical protein